MDNNVFEDFVCAYKNILEYVYKFPEFESSPRGKKIKESLNVHFEIEDCWNNSIWKNIARDLPLKYLSNELILYFSGDRSVEKFGKISKFWNKLTDNEYINSAYGYLIFCRKNDRNEMVQWEWAKKSLVDDKDSRQAIMHYNRPEHQYSNNKDFVCTIYNQFFIRYDKLYLYSSMRSSDLIRGITFDIPYFLLLMQCMRLELLEFYPNLKLGSYMHHSNSLHLYSEHFELAEKMLDNEWIPDSIPKLEENPILNKNIINMSNDICYNGNDKFFLWLEKNRK